LFWTQQKTLVRESRPCPNLPSLEGPPVRRPVNFSPAWKNVLDTVYKI